MPQKAVAGKMSLNLTEEARAELEYLCQSLSTSQSDVIRWAIVVLGVYVRARQEGVEIHLVDPRRTDVTRILELPFPIRRK